MKKEHPNSELLQSQTTTENQNTNNQKSNTELIERHTIKGTGFEIIGNPEKGYMIALGQYRLTEFQPTIYDCEQMIKNRDYELILGMIGAAIETVIPRIENIIHNIIELKQSEYEIENHPKKYSQAKERLKKEEDYKD